MRRILVLGSLNIDLVQRVSRLPAAGETLKGGRLETYVGGKGANQACAAAKLGGDVRMAGKVGTDVFAERILHELRTTGVHTKLVHTSPEPSGTAIILVFPNGENLIVISAGANADISESFALDAVKDMQPGDILLCQLETPLEAVSAACQAAHQRGVITILDPAPARALPDELLSSITILTPNQTETAILLESSEGPANFTEAAAAARRLQSRGTQSVIVKMSAAGCWVADGETATGVEGFEMKAVDTTAAGDTFNGALAASLARGAKVVDTARFANAAAALSVTRPGAIASIPDLAAVEEFLQLRSALT
jgi:ribokinase